MDYVAPADARALPGLRLALTCHAPAPYSMSARAVFDHYNVPYVPVAQTGAGDNADLVAWTGHRNAPVAVYDDEAPRVGWLEILNLAERLGSGPSLFPDDIDQRMFMIGMTNELIGENGFIWNMRLVMLGAGGPERAAKEAQRNPMYAQYGYSEQAHATALEKASGILERFAQHARAQRDAGSPYLVGEQLCALDVYWAYFSLLLSTLPDEQCPMPRGLRKSYDLGGTALAAIDTAVLVEQRNHTLANHLQLPMTF